MRKLYVAAIAGLIIAVVVVGIFRRSPKLPQLPLDQSLSVDGLSASVTPESDGFVQIRFSCDVTNKGAMPVWVYTYATSEADPRHQPNKRFMHLILHNATTRSPPLIARQIPSTLNSEKIIYYDIDGLYVAEAVEPLHDHFEKQSRGGPGILCEPGMSISYNDTLSVRANEWQGLQHPLVFSFLASSPTEHGVQQHWFQSPVLEFDEP